MKVSDRGVERFLRHPDPALRAVVLFGSDLGLVRERADIVARWAVDDLGDPFRTVELAAKTVRDDPARLSDEAAAIAFTGGRKLVRIRDAGESLVEAVRSLLGQDGWEALVVVEAPDLPRRSKLVELFEDDDRAAAIGCYPDAEAGTERVVEETLAKHGLGVDADALTFASEHLGGDRGMTRMEAEKLALYCAGQAKVTRADILAAVGDSALAGIDDAVLAAFDGDLEGLSRALSRLKADGVAAVPVLTAAQRHLHRLQLLVAVIAAGTSPGAAVRALRPPVYFEAAAALERQGRKWTPSVLVRVVGLLTDADLRCRSTGTPSFAIVGQALQIIALLARRDTR